MEISKKKSSNVVVLLGFHVIMWPSGSHKMSPAEYTQIHAHRKRAMQLLKTDDVHWDGLVGKCRNMTRRIQQIERVQCEKVKLKGRTTDKLTHRERCGVYSERM